MDVSSHRYDHKRNTDYKKMHQIEKKYFDLVNA